MVVVWYSHLFQNFPQLIVIHTVKGFSIVNKAEIDVFLELYCLFDDPTDVGNLISGSSTFSKSSLNIWKFSIHVLLKPHLENFEHYFTSMWDKIRVIISIYRWWNQSLERLTHSFKTILLLCCKFKFPHIKCSAFSNIVHWLPNTIYPKVQSISQKSDFCMTDIW